jgi:carbon-monoxide dehydrogenase small subunit
VKITVYVNGTEQAREVEPRLLLIHYLRDELGLTGSHWGCDTSNCGACIVWLDETPVKSCTLLAVMADGRRVTTIEGLSRGSRLDPVQQAFADCHGTQCGFCTPGMMMTARWLLNRNPDPTEADVREAISGQVCRCTGYENIVRSVLTAAQRERTILDQRLRPASAQGGRPADPRPGHLHRRCHPAGHAACRGAAQPSRARQDHQH